MSTILVTFNDGRKPAKYSAYLAPELEKEANVSTIVNWETGEIIYWKGEELA